MRGLGAGLEALDMCAATMTLAVSSTQAAEPKPLSRREKAADALAIQNIMGRYAIYVVANKWNGIGDLFALDDPDVRQSVPFPMSGSMPRDYFSKRAQKRIPAGVMHQHSFL